MDTNKHPDQPANNAPEGIRPETADYATWIHDRVRAELKRLRLALGKSAYAPSPSRGCCPTKPSSTSRAASIAPV